MENIDKLLNDAAVGCILLRTDGSKIDENFYYFTGISRTAGHSSLLVLRKRRRPLVITTNLEYGELVKHKNLDVVQFSTEDEFESLMKTNLKGRVGVNYSCYTLEGYKKLRKFAGKITDVSNFFAKMREIKTKEEIKKIKTACSITEEILESVQTLAKPGVRERDVAVELEHLAKKAGAEEMAFPTIVAYGENGAVPHHRSGNTKIRKGGFLLVDVGVIYDGYCSDLTRTFFAGRANPFYRHTYAVVYDAKQAAINAIFDGAKSSDVYATASNVIEKNLGQKLVHGVGHGLGINVHDFPRSVSWRKGYKLKSSMCLTVEPGYYKEGKFGVRIEDDVVVRKNKAELLSKADSKLIEI